MRSLWHLGSAALLGVILAASGCGKSRDLLLVYSGDCQGYLDPCG